ncbi:MAG: type II toxin-antitoxin system HicA family toxin [Candidatus Bathyarchaeota archaeon]|nr:type II toxin-antitoxin system HicA family toxin [Candidatus Termiticorpusculum sp.]
MSKLFSINYDKVVKVLASIGYTVNHQKGSHIILRFTDTQKYNLLFGSRKNETMVVVPAHKPLGKGMLRTIIREIDLSVEEFNKLAERT